MVLLEDTRRSRWLSFYVPTNEADRLVRVLNGTPCPHVPIFDLLGQIAETVALEVVGAEIDGDDRGVWASLVIARAGRVLRLTCHPADALALALRARAPILASEGALAHACPADRELRDRVVRRWIERLSPSDFDEGTAGTS
jgi:bifunctional DNase/RNase